MDKMYIDPYNKDYQGLAFAVTKDEEHKIILCKLERHTGMLWWKKVEKIDVWGITGVVEEYNYPHERDKFWRIIKVFDYDEKALACRFLSEIVGEIK